MEPITLGLQVAGLAMSAFGAFGAADKSKQISQVSQGIARDEQAINEQKRQAMLLSSRRQQLEVMRQTQRLRAQAVQAGVNQGANLGSGLAGGLGQIQSQGAFNLQGINQNVEIGQNIFGYQNSISQKKMQLADLQGQMATDQAWMGLGNSLTGNAKTITGLGKDAASMFKFPTGFAGPYV